MYIYYIYIYIYFFFNKSKITILLIAYFKLMGNFFIVTLNNYINPKIILLNNIITFKLFIYLFIY